MDEWKKKMFYLSIYLWKKEILPFVITQMDPEGIMLSEISQAEKDNCCIID